MTCKHNDDTCKHTLTTLGCCPKYFECYWCDAMFCQHGYLPDNATPVNVIPWAKLCPDCQAESDAQPNEPVDLPRQPEPEPDEDDE